MANELAEKHARAHVIMMAAGMPHDEVIKSAREKNVTSTHLHQLAVNDNAQNDCRLLLIKLLSSGIH